MSQFSKSQQIPGNIKPAIGVNIFGKKPNTTAKKPPQGSKNAHITNSQFTQDNYSEAGYVSTPIANSVVDFDSYSNAQGYKQAN